MPGYTPRVDRAGLRRSKTATDFCLVSEETFFYGPLETGQLPNVDVLEPACNLTQSSTDSWEDWALHPQKDIILRPGRFAAESVVDMKAPVKALFGSVFNPF